MLRLIAEYARRRARDFAYLFLGALLGVAIRAALPQTSIEVGLGVSKGDPAPEGIWWESQFPTDNRVTSTTFALGASHMLADRVGLRIDYTLLQRSSTNNVAIPNEHRVHEYMAGVLDCASDTVGSYCLTRYHGKGRVDGVHLGAFYSIPIGKLEFQPELGALVYRYKFLMDRTPIESSVQEGIAMDGQHVSWTPYWRLTLKYRALWLRLDHNCLVRGSHSLIGIQDGPITAVLAGFAVPLD